MATTALYRLHGILFPGGTWITELTDTTPKSNVELITAYAGSSGVPGFRGAQAAKPDITFTTPQVETILGLTTGGDGVSIKDCSAGNVDLYYRKTINLTGPVAIGTEVHLVVRARASMLIWTEISARQGQAATIQCRVLPLYASGNAPLVGVGTQSIAANLNVQEEWTLGPVELNAEAAWIDGVEGWTLSQGLEIDEIASDGDVYSSLANLYRSDPMLSIDTPDATRWASHGVTGTALTALQFYLRKRNVDQAANYSDATEEHLKFTNTDNPCGFIYVDQSSGDKATVALKCALRRSAVDTLHPLTVTANSAIALFA